MGLVDDGEVPLRRGKEAEIVVRAGKLVDAGDDAVVLREEVPGGTLRLRLRGEEDEVQAELLAQLVLPLFDEGAGRDDEGAADVAAQDELLDEESRHHGLAGAGIVRQDEAERLLREHRLVDGRKLVGQRLDRRGVDGHHRIEQVPEHHPVGLEGELERLAGRGE